MNTKVATYQTACLVSGEHDVDLRSTLGLGLQIFQDEGRKVHGFSTAVTSLAHFQFDGALIVLRS